MGQSIVARAKAYVRDHLDSDLTVSSIAAELYITPNYLSKLFGRENRESCNEYITRKRMEKARNLLRDTSLPVGEIASAVGYRDQNYFSLTFRKFSGMSPLQFRASPR